MEVAYLVGIHHVLFYLAENKLITDKKQKIFL